MFGSTAGKRRFIVRLVLLLSLMALSSLPDAPMVHAATGDLDLTFAGFGAGGKVNTTGVSGLAHSMALQPDDKIVVAGCSGDSLLVMRYLSNGVLDPTFGTNGKVTFSVNVYRICANAVALQADGKIVVAGVLRTTPSDFMLARLTATGELDTTFGSGGFVSTDFDAGDDSGEAVIVQPDGKIVAAGTAVVGGDEDFAVARYCSNGKLDNGFNCGPGGFGGDGKVSIGFGANDPCYDIALQDDGKLVLAGYTTSGGFDFAVARLNGDGTLDNDFNGDGKLTTGFGGMENASAVGIMPDGRIVVAGDMYKDSSYSVVVARYHSNGLLDDSFDGDGKRTIGGLSGDISDLALQPDGKIVLLGSHQSPDYDYKFTLYRLNPDASLDTTFLGGGNALPDFGGTDQGRALALQPDGRIIAAGYTRPEGSNVYHPVLTRLWPDGTFDSGGQQTLGFDDPLFGPGSHEQALAVAVQADGKIVLAGQINDAGATDYDFALARFLPDGRPDSSFGTNGRVTYGFGGDQFARAVAIQPADGKIVVGGYTSAANGINFMIARFNPNGTPDGNFGFGGFNVLDFLGGTDYAVAMALAPDGKIVMAGPAFNGARTVFGVARFNDNGTPDTSFDEDGKTLYEFSVGPTHYASAVVVQPDKKIVLGGFVGADFALVRLTEAGLVDYGFGTFPYGHTLTDMGGSDYLYALLLTPGNQFVAAGYRVLNGNADFALAQYDSNGVLAVPGPRQPWDKTFVDFGGIDTAYAVDYREDGQIVAAGCTEGGGMVWAQLPYLSGIFTPLKGGTDFVGSGECAYGVKFSGANGLLTAGVQTWEGDNNFALARFETTLRPGTPLAGLSAANSSPTTLGSTTALTATLSSGTNVVYQWTFGDGVAGAGATPKHAYASVGSYTAIVTATSSTGSLVATTPVQIVNVQRKLYLPLVVR